MEKLEGENKWRWLEQGVQAAPDQMGCRCCAVGHGKTFPPRGSLPGGDRSDSSRPSSSDPNSLLFLRFYLFIFRERGKEVERGREISM